MSDVVEETQKQEVQAGTQAVEEEEISEEEDERLPFPNARVVKILRENMRSNHQIRTAVKKELNTFLGNMVKGIAEEMDKEPYFTLDAEHLHKAIRKYKEVDLMRKRMEVIKKMLEKQKVECEETIMDIDAF
jgi:cell division GTPase FtsZ